MPRDPYEVLGVSKSATADEIQKAYRKLSKKHHPDRNPGDKQAEATYKEIQSANEVLSDPVKKSNFDQFGVAGAGGFPGTGGGGGFPGGGNVDPAMAEELFSSFFGGSRGIVRVIAGTQEFVYSLSLPEVAETKWEAPVKAKRGIPRFGAAESSSRDIWQWLAILGALGLLAEWLLYGRFKAPFAKGRGVVQTISRRFTQFRRAS